MIYESAGSRDPPTSLMPYHLPVLLESAEGKALVAFLSQDAGHIVAACHMHHIVGVEMRLPQGSHKHARDSSQRRLRLTARPITPLLRAPGGC